MVTTIWIAPGGDWNDPQNWSYGVPTATDDAVLPRLNGGYVITGDGPAASLAVRGGAWRLGGTHSFGTLVQLSADFGPDTGGSLTIQSGTIESDPLLRFSFFGSPASSLNVSGATVGGGTLTFVTAKISGSGGRIDSALVLTDGLDVALTGTIAGQITGAGSLVFGASVSSQGPTLTLANVQNSFSGGLDIMGGVLHAVGPGALGAGAVSVDGGSLVMDSGTLTGTISAAAQFLSSITTASADLVVFSAFGLLNYTSASGSTTVIGARGAGNSGSFDEAPPHYGVLNVQGGGGSVTVFAGDEYGSIFGGTAGHNVIIAGAATDSLLPYRPGAPFVNPKAGGVNYAPSPVTVGGGGDGDLLVLTGGLNNLVAAAGGNETLTGTTATGNNTFFGGTGADLIAAGTGSDLVIAGSGAATISGGAGGFTRIVLGSGPAVVLGGAGVESVQAGRGDMTVFAGAGYDRIGVVNGQSGGSVAVAGFKLGVDQIAASGYSAPPTVAATSAGTVLTFSDNSRITLFGVAQLAPNTVLAG